MIELYLLEQLIAFSQRVTLSKAAEELHISQPALSQSMKKLEAELGVPLFERAKNRLVLNENGILAAQLGEKLLEQSREMEERLRLFDRSRRTLSLGVCAPVPCWDLSPLLTRLYPQMTVSIEMKSSDKELIAGLKKDLYQLIVTHSPPDAGLYGRPFRRERLFLSVPLAHPLADRKELTPADIDGQNLLLYTDIGFWHSFCREKLPNAHFLMMNEWDAFGEVAGTGAFPSFATDAHMERDGVPQNRAVIPIIDEQAEATYYCVCSAEDRDKYRQVFKALEKLQGTDRGTQDGPFHQK